MHGSENNRMCLNIERNRFSLFHPQTLLEVVLEYFPSNFENFIWFLQGKMTKHLANTTPKLAKLDNNSLLSDSLICSCLIHWKYNPRGPGSQSHPSFSVTSYLQDGMQSAHISSSLHVHVKHWRRLSWNILSLNSITA